MKKKGFTLAELLGVIVLLGVLAIVAFPPILNQLNNSKSKLSAATLKVIGIGAEQFVDDHGSQYPIRNGNVYCISLKTLTDYGYLKSPILDASSGEAIDEETNMVKMTIDGFNKYSYELVEEGNCDENKNNASNLPSITVTNLSVTSSSIIIEYDVQSNGNAVNKVSCKYGEDKKVYENEVSTATTDTCRINNIKNGLKYYYKVCAIDELGNVSNPCITGVTDSLDLPNPVITIQGYQRDGVTPMAPVNGYVPISKATVTYKNENIEEPSHYVMTTVQTTSNLNVTKSCGTGSNPGECTNITATTTLEANTWYKVESNNQIIVEFNTQGVVRARTYDKYGVEGKASGNTTKVNPTAVIIHYDPTLSGSECTDVDCALNELYDIFS